jgi:hypothetical protein
VLAYMHSSCTAPNQLRRARRKPPRLAGAGCTAHQAKTCTKTFLWQSLSACPAGAQLLLQFRNSHAVHPAGCPPTDGAALTTQH